MLKSRLSVILAEQGVRQDYLSEKTGISKTTISNIVNNKTNGLKYETINELAKFFRVNPGDLFDYYDKDISLSLGDFLDIRDFRVPDVQGEFPHVSIGGCFFNIIGSGGLTNKISFYVVIEDVSIIQTDRNNYVDAWGDSDYLIIIRTNKMNDLAPDSLDPFLEKMPKTFFPIFEKIVIDFFSETLYEKLEDKSILKKGKYTININTRDTNLYIPLKITK